MLNVELRKGGKRGSQKTNKYLDLENLPHQGETLVSMRLTSKDEVQMTSLMLAPFSVVWLLMQNHLYIPFMLPDIFSRVTRLNVIGTDTSTRCLVLKTGQTPKMDEVLPMSERVVRPSI